MSSCFNAAAADELALSQRLSALARGGNPTGRPAGDTRIQRVNRVLTRISLALMLLSVGAALWSGGDPMTPVADLPSIYRNWLRAVMREQGDVEAVLAQHRERVQRLPDPFAELIHRQPQASRRVVLWEDDRVIVVYDTFAASPRALVVAKADGVFPSDVDPQTVEHLERTAREVGAALIAAARVQGSPQYWINPPQAQAAPRVYVNVQPGLFRGDVDFSGRFFRRAATHLEASLGSI